MKKLLTLVLAILMVAGSLTAFAEEAPMEFLWMGFTDTAGTPILETDKVTEAIEERFNVEITKAPVDWTSQEQIALYFAEGHMPDVMLLRQLTREKLIEEELIREIPVEWLYEYMPNYMAALGTFLDQEIIDNQLLLDGKCWGVPHSDEGYAAGFNTIINMTWAKAVGIEKVPETLEEYYDYCYKVTFMDPDGNGLDDTYGIGSAGYGLGGFYPVFYYYGIIPGSYYNVDGTVTAALQQTDNYKAMLQTLADWYAEGIIDPEFATIDWVGYHGNSFAGKYGSFTHRLTSAESDIASFKNNFPENEYEAMVGIIDQNGEWATDTVVPTLYTTYPIYFGAKTSDEKVIKALQILETMTSDPEMVLLMRFCSDAEETNYVIKENGSYAFIDGFWSRDVNELATYGYCFYAVNPSSMIPFPTYGDLVINNLEKANGMKKIYSGAGFVTNGTNEAANELSADLATIENNYALNVILGRKTIEDTYDDFVTEWLNSGGQKVLDGYQAILVAE